MNKTNTGTDKVEYAYNAKKPGTYHVVATYRSGDTNNGNKLAWSEANNKITAGNITTPHTKVNNVLSVGTVEFDIVVTEAGEGTLILQPVDNSGAPQLDKLEITPKDVALESYDITATASEGGTITAEGLADGKVSVTEGESATFTITPNDGYRVDSLTVDGTAVDVVTEYTFSDVTANHTIAVTFAKDAVTVAKEDLLAAINTANEKLAQTEVYTEASLDALQNAVNEAQAIYDKADATQTEVDNAKANVEAKIAALKAKDDNKKDDSKDDNNGSNNNGGNNNGNTNAGSKNNGSSNNGTANGGNGTSNAVKAAKTGDTANVAGMAMLCLAAGLVAVMARRKRTN